MSYIWIEIIQAIIPILIIIGFYVIILRFKKKRKELKFKPIDFNSIPASKSESGEYINSDKSVHIMAALKFWMLPLIPLTFLLSFNTNYGFEVIVLLVILFFFLFGGFFFLGYTIISSQGITIVKFRIDNSKIESYKNNFQDLKVEWSAIKKICLTMITHWGFHIPRMGYEIEILCSSNSTRFKFWTKPFSKKNILQILKKLRDLCDMKNIPFEEVPDIKQGRYFDNLPIEKNNKSKGNKLEQEEIIEHYNRFIINNKYLEFHFINHPVFYISLDEIKKIEIFEQLITNPNIKIEWSAYVISFLLMERRENIRLDEFSDAIQFKILDLIEKFATELRVHYIESDAYLKPITIDQIKSEEYQRGFKNWSENL